MIIIRSFITTLFIFSTCCVQSQRFVKKVGDNSTIISPSAVLELESINKGFLPPRMTFAQRSAINAPATGLIVWCIDCGLNGELQVFNGAAWTTMTGSAAALNIFAFVPTTNGGHLRFMKHNLGADTTADPLTPSWKLNGAYFQWGKKPVDTNNNSYRTKGTNASEGFVAAPTDVSHNSSVASAINWNPSFPLTTSWNVNENSPSKTLTDPCPNGYRVPTRNEWMSIYNNTGIIDTRPNWINNVSNFYWGASVDNYSVGKLVSNVLYLPAAGFFGNDGGGIFSRGLNGVYWSSTSLNAVQAYCLYFSNTFLSATHNLEMRYSISVRCVKE
jgi:uncharacterized protein (TIGR02145 family)